MNTSMKELAVKKLEDQYKSLKTNDKYINAVKLEVTDALKKFCEQSPEFAQAVIQGGTLCLKASVKRQKGNKLSDLAAYADAARFFFPGCALKCEFTLYLCGGTDQQRFQADEIGGMQEKNTSKTTNKGIEPAKAVQSAVVLDLFDLL